MKVLFAIWAPAALGMLATLLGFGVLDFAGIYPDPPDTVFFAVWFSVSVAGSLAARLLR